jgi:hypothetical protein
VIGKGSPVNCGQRIFHSTDGWSGGCTTNSTAPLGVLVLAPLPGSPQPYHEAQHPSTINPYS